MRLAIVLIVTALIGIAGGGWWYYDQSNGEPTVLTVAAGQRGSDAHSLLVEVGEVLERHSDKVRLSVLSSKNSSTNITMVNNGDYDLGTISSDTPVSASIRLIADLFPDYFILITRADKSVHSIPDLRGKRIAVPEDGSSELLAFWSVIDHYDMPTGSFDFISTSLEDGAARFLAGEVDGVFLVRSLRDAALLRLIEDAGLKKMSLRFVPIEQASAITLKRPFFKPGTVVRGAFDGNPVLPRRDVTTVTVNRLLVSNDKADADAIRELTRVLFENRLDLLIRIPLAATIVGANNEAGASLPFHDGAMSYYNRDAPSFLQENAEPIALIVTLIAMLISGLLALRSRFSATQKNRLDSYNYQLLDIAEEAQKSTTTSELKQLKKELFSILETVVKALDTDDVTEEGFQSFSLLWESVRETINDRVAELKN